MYSPYSFEHLKKSILVILAIIVGMIWLLLNSFNFRHNKINYINEDAVSDTKIQIEKFHDVLASKIEIQNVKDISDPKVYDDIGNLLLFDLVVESTTFMKFNETIKKDLLSMSNESKLKLISGYIQKYPNDWVAYAIYGINDTEVGYNNIGYVDKAIELGGNIPAVYITRGIYLYSAGEYENAKRDFIKARKLDPELIYQIVYKQYKIDK